MVGLFLPGGSLVWSIMGYIGTVCAIANVLEIPNSSMTGVLERRVSKVMFVNTGDWEGGKKEVPIHTFKVYFLLADFAG